MRWTRRILWHSFFPVVMVQCFSFLAHRVPDCRVAHAGTCMLCPCNCDRKTEERHNRTVSSNRLRRTDGASKKHNIRAGVVIDGPQDMKPLVEAFAKQVSRPCLCRQSLDMHEKPAPNKQ